MRPDPDFIVHMDSEYQKEADAELAEAMKDVPENEETKKEGKKNASENKLADIQKDIANQA